MGRRLHFQFSVAYLTLTDVPAWQLDHIARTIFIVQRYILNIQSLVFFSVEILSLETPFFSKFNKVQKTDDYREGEREGVMEDPSYHIDAPSSKNFQEADFFVEQNTLFFFAFVSTFSVSVLATKNHL